MFIDIILNTEIPIYTYTTGYIKSGAVLIFLSGDKRFISYHSTVLIHQISQCLDGTHQYIEDNYKSLNKSWKQYKEFIISRTYITDKKLNKIKKQNKDWEFSSKKLLNLM